MQNSPNGLPHHSPPLRSVEFGQSHAAAHDSEPAGAGAGAAAAAAFAAPPGGGVFLGTQAQLAERLPTEDPRFANAVKVSHGSNIPAVAGKIAHSLRSREWPTLLVAGNSSIHTAVRCCYTAARFVQQEGLNIEFEPRFRDTDHGRALLALSVLPSSPPSGRAPPAPAPPYAPFAPPGPAGQPPLPLPPSPWHSGGGGHAAAALLPPQFGGGAPGPPFEIKVSVHSRHAKVGAALSARLGNGGGRPVVLLALGETAVANAVMAAAHAAHYLTTQGGGRRLAVGALAATVLKDGDRLQGVQLWVRLQRLEEGAESDGALAAGLAGLSLS
ncbi:hypothetical protein Rsub_11197 [Raphidocelis subcapitata]|uniref:Uncharacterized protein n=1 Tax=Raphidocelis subcapitata TaxID=307507 RepID=A0A2V0PKJ4_9CHLO|nr:hypothetical protein Rsub_11197 [Raphidocelis subcapitata]|eukprot:GBF97847.1 hypothetical protein Rsub_11197 [Raphidocelis subcapitata]